MSQRACRPSLSRLRGWRLGCSRPLRAPRRRGRACGHRAGSGPQPQPVLGTADASTVLMGAATAGEPGEAWAYKVLPLDVPPPSDASGRVQFAAPPIGWLVAGPARVRARQRRRLGLDDPGNAAERSRPALPGDGTRPPLRADHPARRRAARRRGPDAPVGKQVVVLARDPGGRFQVLPEPPAGVLPGARAKAATRTPEVLAEDERHRRGRRRRGRKPEGHTEAFFGALGRTQDTSVIRWNGTKWSREPVELPKGYEGSFTILALAGSSPQNLWLLGKAERRKRPRDHAVQARRNRRRSRWEPVELGSALFAQAATPAQGVSGVAPLSSPGQPLTASDQGVWIDGNLQAPGGGATGMTSRSTTTSPKAKVTASWCDAHATGGEALCTYPFGARFGRARRLSQLRLRRPRLRLADHHQSAAARGRRLDQHGLLPEPRRHDFPVDARRGCRQRSRRRLLQPDRRLAGRPRADHRHGRAPAPGELAGVRARAVHRGGPGAGHRRRATRAPRRWRSAPMASSPATPPGRAGSASSC